MGRAKLNMELIAKEKSRNITFKKRKEGLLRKMHEFTTLCDVRACMIIYGPRQDNNPGLEPEIWPQNPEQVRRIIDIYKSKNKDSGNKTFGLSDFFLDRKRKIEEELAKLRKKNMETKYPTWLEFMNYLSEIQLREFANTLRTKLEFVKARIEFLKRSKDGAGLDLVDWSHMKLLSQTTSSHHHAYYAAATGAAPVPPAATTLIQRGIEFEVINQKAIHHQPMPFHQFPSTNTSTITTLDPQNNVNQNASMTMLLMNDNDHVQFTGGNGGTSSGNLQCAAAFKRQVYYEATAAAGMADNMVCHNARPLARYYGTTLTPMGATPHMQCPVMVPQFASQRESDCDGYGLYNHRSRFFD